MNVKNKKVIWFIIISIFIIGIIMTYIFKTKTMYDIYNKPNFTGTVLGIGDNTILILVNKDEEEIMSSDKISVSLNTKLGNDRTTFKVKDKVQVFYDGTILESYPAQINNVYTIVLITE